MMMMMIIIIIIIIIIRDHVISPKRILKDPNISSNSSRKCPNRNG